MKTLAVAIVIIYISIENETDYFEGQIVKFQKLKTLGVVDHWDKNYVILNMIQETLILPFLLLYDCFFVFFDLENGKMIAFTATQ